MPEIGDKVFFKDGPTGHPQSSFVVGQTSRSWYMSANARWAGCDPQVLARHALRHEKKEVIFITEEQFAITRWADDNRSRIHSAIWRLTPEQLKKIAEIVDTP